MNGKEFKKLRKKLNKTQKEIAQLLGVSVKAVNSYEQGWRNISPHIERQMFFLSPELRETKKTESLAGL